MAWPTLTRRPRTEQHTKVPNVVKHETEGGTILRRRQFTRERRTFSLSYDLLSTADAALIQALYDTNNLHTAFTFVDKDSVSRTVVFESPISFIEQFPGWFQFDTFELKEV